jgi:MinD superfamily P-loop ATPase
MAAALGRGVRRLDCAVEVPTAHLFLHPEIEQVEEVTTFIPEIDDELCTGCKKCAEICRFRALTVVSGKVLVFPELCHSCGGCVEVCEEGAVGDGSRELGRVESGTAGDILFSHGRLRVGEAMSPPLIQKVRSIESNNGITIIDAPPGTSCPVIAAIKGADFVLMVTEPTPFGLHDLKLGVEAIKILGIPCGLVINRSDIGDNGVRDFAAAEDIPVLLEIPFDRRIAEAYSTGKLIIEVQPEWADKFRDLYNRIEILARG